MSLTSYRAAPPRDKLENLPAQPGLSVIGRASRRSALWLLHALSQD